MTQEALKLALEALDNLLYWDNGKPEYDEAREAITAIKEALREHAMREVQRLGQEIEQEPVKYSDYEPDGVHHNKPQQEPVAYWKEHAQGLQRDYDSLLAEFQAQRTWVGLTDEEANELWESTDSDWELMKRTEAKLKEKNMENT